MRKKLLAALLALTLVGGMVTGCGSGSASSTDTTSGSSTDSTETESGDPEEIVVRFLCLGTVPSDLQKVEDAINEITIPKINVKVSYEAISAANYNNQIALDMTSGEQLDVFFTQTYSTMVSNNQLLDISSYLDEYGQDIKDTATDEWLKATSVGDKIYAVPVLCGKATSLQIAMRTDILDKYGLTADYDMNKDFNDDGMQMTLSQITDIFKTVKENEPDMIINYPGASGTLQLENLINYDKLTDGYGVLMGDDGWNVVDLYETDEFKDVLQQLRDWYLSGYIKSDAATDTESYTSYALAGRLFSVFSNSETGLDTQLKTSTGYDYTCIKIKTPLITSSSVNNMVWGVSSTTEHPEASVKFLNLAYSDKDLANTMMYGVKDTHWVLNDEGTVSYPDGLGADNSGYPFSTYWEMPCSLVGTPLEGNSTDYNQTLLNNNKNAETSRALGFSFDQSSVKSECSAVASVCTEYTAGLLTGSLDIDENYDAFISKLKDAGIDTIIAEKQSQLDSWRETNNIE